MPDVTFFDQIISDADGMHALVEEDMQNLTIADNTCNGVLAFWVRLMHSKTGPGTYTMPLPVHVLVRFPGVEFDPPPKCRCVLLDEQDVLDTDTVDSSKLAWHSCTMTLSVADSEWELPDEISCLCAPPAPCRVTIHLTDLKFKAFADMHRLEVCFRASQRLVVSKGSVCTNSQIKELVKAVQRAAHFSHCNNARAAAEQIWYKLVGDRRDLNLFNTPMPYTIRMVTSIYDTRNIPHGSVACYPTSVLEKFGVPVGQDMDKCIGLFSCVLHLTLSRVESRIVQSSTELWPNIQPILHKLSPPGCYVYVYFSSVKFVSIVSEDDIRDMWCHEEKNSVMARVGRWWN